MIDSQIWINWSACLVIPAAVLWWISMKWSPHVYLFCAFGIFHLDKHPMSIDISIEHAQSETGCSSTVLSILCCQFTYSGFSSIVTWGLCMPDAKWLLWLPALCKVLFLQSNNFCSMIWVLILCDAHNTSCLWNECSICCILSWLGIICYLNSQTEVCQDDANARLKIFIVLSTYTVASHMYYSCYCQLETDEAMGSFKSVGVWQEHVSLLQEKSPFQRALQLGLRHKKQPLNWI